MVSVAYCPVTASTIVCHRLSSNPTSLKMIRLRPPKSVGVVIRWRRSSETRKPSNSKLDSSFTTERMYSFVWKQRENDQVGSDRTEPGSIWFRCSPSDSVSVSSQWQPMKTQQENGHSWWRFGRRENSELRRRSVWDLWTLWTEPSEPGHEEHWSSAYLQPPGFFNTIVQVLPVWAGLDLGGTGLWRAGREAAGLGRKHSVTPHCYTYQFIPVHYEVEFIQLLSHLKRIDLKNVLLSLICWIQNCDFTLKLNDKILILFYKV